MVRLNVVQGKSPDPTMAVENLPAARSFLSLRNLGYTLEEAVADVIDNSISAGATIIEVNFKRDRNNQFSLSILDDADGMSKIELFEAMRLGSDTDYADEDLGKFGMGLKTASLSQCRKLTVASRSILESKVHVFQWDIDHVSNVNKWEVLELPYRKIESLPIFRHLKKDQGTTVLWEDMEYLDKELASYQNPTLADNYVGRVLSVLKLHLRMTFHRFLDGTLSEDQTIKLIFNEVPLEPWDPFCRKETNTRIMDSLRFSLPEISGKEVIIEPYVLPIKVGEKGFSSLTAWEEAKGLLSWNDSQGYYIYRANRLIHYGGWLRTRAKDEHTKYARVAISFSPGLDDALNISVNKAKIKLPASLYDFLKTEVNPKVVEAAQSPYRTTGKQSKHEHKNSQNMINKTAKAILPKRTVEVRARKDGQITVRNPHGTFIANTLEQTLRLNLRKKFGVEAGVVANDKMWELVCKPDGGFVVVLNSEHAFYNKIYTDNQKNATLMKLIDGILFAMAYAELYSASNGTKWIFDEIQDTISMVLEELANKI